MVDPSMDFAHGVVARRPAEFFGFQSHRKAPA